MLAIALIGLAAFALKVWALDFGLPSWLHPDEFSFVFFRLVSLVVISIHIFSPIRPSIIICYPWFT